MSQTPTHEARTSLPPATGYHRVPYRIANGVLRAAWRLGLTPTSLAEDELIAAAREATGLHDFGDDPFLEPMRILLRAIEDEADLNPIGRMLARQGILRVLKHRLWAQELFTRHPEILERELEPPVVIVGLARTGTTKLHRLLACNDAFRSLPAWESLNPVPWPESFTAERDPRITAIEQGLKVVLYLSPQIQQVHPLGAEEIEEEVGLIEHSFSSQLWEVVRKIPTFADWLMTHDQTDAYAYMVKLFKLIEWYRGDADSGAWILKSPQHMQDLDSLLRVFPEAKIICTHRDPVKAVGSACSMAWNSIVRDSDSVDPFWIGEEWCNKTESMVRKTLDIRDAHTPERFLDIQFADVTRDPIGQVRRIHDFLERPLTPEIEKKMQAWLDANPVHARGAHRYSLPDFGLDPADVEARFSFYRERFRIPHE